MSKVTKVVLIVGGAMVALGIVFTVLGFMVFRSSSSRDKETKLEHNEVVIEDTFTDIDVFEVSDDVIIAPSKDGKITVDYYDTDDIVHKVEVSGDTLRIVAEDAKAGAPWWERINIGFDFADVMNGYNTDKKTTIYLPEDSYGALTVNTISGEVVIPEKYAFNNITINTTSGSITSDCTATGNIDLGTVSGEINMSTVNANKFTASTTSGSIVLSDAVVSGKIDLNTVSGAVVLDNVTGGTINGSSVSGDFELTAIASDSIDLDTTSGEITGTIAGDHEYDIDTVSGEIEIPSSIDGAPEVNISTVSGDVELEAA